MKKTLAVLGLVTMFAAPVFASPAFDVSRATVAFVTPAVAPALYAAQTEPAPAPLDWKGELVKLVVGTALTALAIAASFALAKLREWADEKAKESKLAKALAALPHMAEAVWADVYADLKDDIEADAADGKIDPEELAELRVEAVASLKKAMVKHGLGALKDAFGPLLDSVLGKVVEAAQAKAEATAASPQ